MNSNEFQVSSLCNYVDNADISWDKKIENGIHLGWRKHYIP